MARLFSGSLVLLMLLGTASPARPATWSIGPSVGFEVMSTTGQSVAVFAAPASTDLFAVGARPGLRLGATDASGHHQVFFDTAVHALSSSGSTLHVMSGTFNYLYAFKSGSSPYVTAGFGFSYFGYDSSSELLTLYGLGLGGRHRLGHGHGAIRLEARFDRATSPEFEPDALSIVGVRLGFDLDLN